MLSIKQVELRNRNGRPGNSIMWLGGISCFVSWGDHFSEAAVNMSLELPATSKHRHNMTERLSNRRFTEIKHTTHKSALASSQVFDIVVAISK